MICADMHHPASLDNPGSESTVNSTNHSQVLCCIPCILFDAGDKDTADRGVEKRESPYSYGDTLWARKRNGVRC